MSRETLCPAEHRPAGIGGRAQPRLLDVDDADLGDAPAVLQRRRDAGRAPDLPAPF
jgi:hypothetical protein